MAKPYLLIHKKAKDSRGRPVMAAKRFKDFVTQEMLEEKFPDWVFKPLDYWPTLEEIEEALMDGTCEAVGCGCPVEPDGYCPCGNPSWLLALGYV